VFSVWQVVNAEAIIAGFGGIMAVYDDIAGWPGDRYPVPCRLRRDKEIEGRMNELFCSLRFT
jgi:hypothetical protein